MKRILIVEDNPANLYMLKTLLEGEGFAVDSAENGKEALDIANTHPPDLIISDILMPIMDGYTLCRLCKSHERLQHIPFMFYTAEYTEQKDEHLALGVGADRFVLKPQEPEAFLRILREMQEDGAEKQPASKPLGEEMEFFRQHNEVLFRKLERKMTDLETANQKLQSTEEQYRLSFQNATDIIFTTDTRLNVLTVSPSVERMLGYKPQDFIGRSISETASTLTPESRERAVAEVNSILNGETISASIFSFVARDGTTKYGEISGSPIMKEGRIIGMIGLIRDVTKRKRAEDELRRTNVFLDSIIENIPNMLFLKTAKDLRFVRFNRAGEELLGYSRDHLLGKNDYDFFSKDQADHFTGKDREVLRNKVAVDTPAEPIQTRHRGERILHTKKVPLLDANGEPEYLLGISEDITERKKAEEELLKTTERLRRLLGGTVQAISMAVETRDPYTSGHQRRTARLARAIAAEMHLAADRVDFVRIVATIHDIGKIAVPAEILSKPSRLSDLEFRMIMVHAQAGYDILKDVEFPWPVAEVVLQHHERMDGSGYPRGLSGDDILLESRILAVADTVEAMASHRPYRPRLGIDHALEEISKNRGKLYDPEVVNVCLRLFREKNYRVED